MGVLSKMVPSPTAGIPQHPYGMTQAWKTFTENAPRFSAFDGPLYEQAKTRAIVECIAKFCSKLKPEFVMPEGGTGINPRVQRLIESWPNDDITWPDFLRRTASILFADTTAYVVPQLDRDNHVIGLYPLKPSYAEVCEYMGEPYIIFHLIDGETLVYEYYQVAILTRFQLYSDIFGGGNVPLTSTLRLMEAQRQAEELALQNGARIRFIGKLGGLVHPKDMDEKRRKFGEENLGPANTSGLMVYDNTWEDIKQIDEQHYTIDTDEMERIDKTLHIWFGINDHILTNDYNEQQWVAFYEGCIEPFALMLGEALTKMLMTVVQRRHGNRIMFSSSYLEYGTMSSKLKVINDGLDRGIMFVNEARAMLQLPDIPGGNIRFIRGEYYALDEDNNVIAESGGHNTGSVDDTAKQLPPPDDEDDDKDDDAAQTIDE